MYMIGTGNLPLKSKKDPVKSISLVQPVGHPLRMLAAYLCLSRGCKELMKAEVCQKVTFKWLEACDRQCNVLQKCQE